MRPAAIGTDSTLLTEQWQYDDVDRLILHGGLTGLTTGSRVAPTQRLGVDALGRADTVTWGNGLVQQYDYTKLGRLWHFNDQLSGPLEYHYDPAGNRTRDAKFRYLYNELNQLTRKDAVLFPVCAVTYRYDPDGNEIAVHPLDSTCVGENPDSLRYDAAGRLVWRETRNGTTGVFHFRTYWYDGLGRRVFEVDSVPGIQQEGVAFTRTWWLDDNEVVTLTADSAAIDAIGPELVRSGTSLSTQGEWVFHAPGVDHPLGSLGYGGAGFGTATKQHFFMPDWRGSIARITDQRGTDLSLASMSFAPYGAAEQPTGESAKNPGFNGRSGSGGLVYLRNRWYDPNTGRFTQEDPIGAAGGSNLYAYAGNDPVTYADPFGLCTEADGWKDCDKMISAAQGVRILANAITSGEWTYSQGPSGGGHGLDPTTPLPGQQLGDCTDFCRSATQGALGGSWKSAYKASTSMFKAGDHPGYTEVEAGAAQTGDVIVQGGHAGLFIGRDQRGNVWGWANNGSPHNAKGTGYSDKDTGARKFNNGSFGKGDPRFYRPITP